MRLHRYHPYSRVHVLGHKEIWSPGWDAYFLVETLKKLSIQYSKTRVAIKQVVYLPTKYAALSSQYHRLSNKVVFDYFHGDPSISPRFRPLFSRICRRRDAFSGIRVSHSGVEEIFLNEGFEGKVFRIPLGVDLDWFTYQNSRNRREIRQELGISDQSVVVGSFQKDGEGWGEGLSPKLIKGPDIFLKAIEVLKTQVPNLFVILTGPARGFIKTGLEKLSIPYKHLFVDYSQIGKYYHALDVYLITSREEGGPKALLEAMASGVPLVTTRVGQAIDLVDHQKNAWIVEVEDYEAVAHWAQYAIENYSQIGSILREGRRTAEANSHAALVPVWAKFFDRFLD